VGADPLRADVDRTWAWLLTHHVAHHVRCPLAVIPDLAAYGRPGRPRLRLRCSSTRTLATRAITPATHMGNERAAIASGRPTPVAYHQDPVTGEFHIEDGVAGWPGATAPSARPVPAADRDRPTVSAVGPLARARSVLAVYAHPDDETFGLGAALGAFVDAGTAVGGLCLTHGEASTLGAAPTTLRTCGQPRSPTPPGFWACATASYSRTPTAGSPRRGWPR
jgi:hypothetical protein